MGQKVDPRGLRLGINKDWESKWYAEKGDYVTKLNNDLKIRDFLLKELKNAAVSECYINPGVVYRRWKPASRSRVDKRFKRTSHITVKVSDGKEA